MPTPKICGKTGSPKASTPKTEPPHAGHTSTQRNGWMRHAALAVAEAEHERTTAQIINVFSSDAGPMVADTIEVLVRNAAGVRA